MSQKINGILFMLTVIVTVHQYNGGLAAIGFFILSIKDVV